MFKDLINNNINMLNINYEKNPLMMKYKLLEKESNKDINKLFPKLLNINIGGECMDWLNNIKVKDFPKYFKLIKTISNPIKINKIIKIKKKFNKHKIGFIHEFITNTNNKEKEEEEEEEEEGDEESDEEESEKGDNNQNDKVKKDIKEIKENLEVKENKEEEIKKEKNGEK